MTNNRAASAGTWSERWRASILQHLNGAAESHAEKNSLRITRLDIEAGRITSAILDGRKSSDNAECTVTVSIPVWSDEQWAQAVDLLSRQALFAAQLLAGEFPDELNTALQTHGLSLSPEPYERIEVSCTCEHHQPDAAVCPHVARVLSHTAEMLDDDPWLLFLLRGRRRQQVLRMLRRARGVSSESKNENGNGYAPATAQQVADAHAMNESQLATSLEDEVESFWGSGRVLEQYRPHIVRPLSELILLRRLGPPAFTHANAEVYDTLQSIYRKVTDRALALAYEEDPPVGPVNDDSVE